MRIKCRFKMCTLALFVKNSAGTACNCNPFSANATFSSSILAQISTFGNLLLFIVLFFLFLFALKPYVRLNVLAVGQVNVGE